MFILAITCNAILKGNFEDSETYSVWYGQTYHQPIEPTVAADTQKTIVSVHPVSNVLFGQKIYEVQNVSELNQIPNSFDTSEIIDHMFSFFEGGVSNIRIYQVINIVYIFRKLVTRKVASYGSKRQDDIHS